MNGPLWLVRHGHTVVHGTGGVAGRSDVALSAEGREALERLGSALADHLLGTGAVPRWTSSPLGRTRESAALLRAASGQSSRALAIDPRLVELDFGHWEGMSWEAVHREHGEALAAWGEDWVSRSPPGGESFAEQAARCGAWFDEAVDRTLVRAGIEAGQEAGQEAGGEVSGEDRASANEDGLIVLTHGGSIRALACRLLGWPLRSAMRLTVDPATVCRFERDARTATGWRLTSANLARFD